MLLHSPQKEPVVFLGRIIEYGLCSCSNTSPPEKKARPHSVLPSPEVWRLALSESQLYPLPKMREYSCSTGPGYFAMRVGRPFDILTLTGGHHQADTGDYLVHHAGRLGVVSEEEFLTTFGEISAGDFS
jgi:hypothetical protein